MVTSRRIPRSRRAVGATGLLISAVLVAVAGIVVATVPALIAATTYAVVVGAGATHLLAGELAHKRREWALQRAHMIDDHRTVSVARSREHIAFATQMGLRVRLRDAQLATLRDSLVTAEIEMAHARERAAEERARSEALKADLDSAQSDLESARLDLRQANDALVASESAELHARAQILAWEEAASEESHHQHHRTA